MPENLVEKAGHTRLFAAVMRRIAPRFDRAMYRRFGGRILGCGPRILLLTTVGRKSGEQRTNPLLYVRRGQQVAVAASNWGRRRHPEWSEDLLENPRARVRIGDEVGEYRAHLASPVEKQELWPLFLEVWPAYETYQERSGRDIRVFVLEPSRKAAPAVSGEG